MNDTTELPTWEECQIAVRSERFTALQYFIWANEIDAPTEPDEWRKRLAAVISEARGRLEAVIRSSAETLSQICETDSLRRPIEVTEHNLRQALGEDENGNPL